MSLFPLSRSLDKNLRKLPQIQKQNDEILLLLEEMKNNDDNWPQEKKEEALNQARKALDNIESLLAAVIETNYKIEELDKGLIDRLSSVMSELHKQELHQARETNSKSSENDNRLEKKVKGNRRLLWLLFFLQFLGTGALVFIIHIF